MKREPNILELQSTVPEVRGSREGSEEEEPVNLKMRRLRSEMRGGKNEDMNKARVLKYRPNYQRAHREFQKKRQNVCRNRAKL